MLLYLFILSSSWVRLSDLILWITHWFRTHYLADVLLRWAELDLCHTYFTLLSTGGHNTPHAASPQTCELCGWYQFLSSLGFENWYVGIPIHHFLDEFSIFASYLLHFLSHAWVLFLFQIMAYFTACLVCLQKLALVSLFCLLCLLDIVFLVKLGWV